MAWDEACAQADRFIAPIEAYEARYLEEMRGIAAGAGVGLSDILALNLRTEIMFAQRGGVRGQRRSCARRLLQCRGAASSKRERPHAARAELGLADPRPQDDRRSRGRTGRRPQLS